MSRGRPPPMRLLLLLLVLLGLVGFAHGCLGGGGGGHNWAAMEAAQGSLDNKFGVGGGLNPPAFGARVWKSKDGTAQIGVGVSSDFNKKHAIGFAFKKSFRKR